MSKYISIVGYSTVIIGLAILSLSVMTLWQQQNAQDSALHEAKNMIINKKTNSSTIGLNQDSNKENKEKDNKHTGDIIGLLVIPSLNKELAILEGVDEDDLEKGVGHIASTAMPGENDQIVLSGHRDTVFRKLGSLQIGDELQVLMIDESFTYEIKKTYIVDNGASGVIRSTAPVEQLTLTTCYPFSFIGNAPQRYIIEAERK